MTDKVLKMSPLHEGEGQGEGELVNSHPSKFQRYGLPPHPAFGHLLPHGEGLSQGPVRIRQIGGAPITGVFVNV